MDIMNEAVGVVLVSYKFTNTCPNVFCGIKLMKFSLFRIDSSVFLPWPPYIYYSALK